MAKSISQQVAEFLKAHPAATNADLYRMFPKVRENTLRNYKYKFKNSVDQFRSSRKKNRSNKVSEPAAKADSQSLRKKVFDFFQKNPDAGNQKLYDEFTGYSKNKLRHYKSSFFKSVQVAEKEKAKDKLKKLSKQLKPDTLENRVARLEQQVKYICEIIVHQSGKPGFKTTLTDTAVGIEKKVKELEETIAGFIAVRQKKIKSEMSNLEDIQQLVSDKISSFIKGFK